MVGVFILVLQYKDINSSQFVEIFKVKTTSLYKAKKGFILLFFSRPSKSAFSRHGNVRASSTLFVWLNENVLFSFLKSAFSRHGNVRASSTLFVWLNENVLFSFLKSAFSRHGNVRASSTLFIWLNENVRKPHFAVRGVRTKLFVVRLQVFCSRTTSILY